MCEYCSDAFIDLTKEDNAPEMLSENRKRGLFGEVVWFSNFIDSHGNLVVFVDAVKNDCSGGGNAILTKKIRFCPMCGAEIPKITPTDRHKRGRPHG